MATNVIPAGHVQMARPQPPAAVRVDDCAGQPRITLVKEGMAVRAIEITCLCGQVIRLDCVYSED